jgi:hypothetical protein
MTATYVQILLQLSGNVNSNNKRIPLFKFFFSFKNNEEIGV